MGPGNFFLDFSKDGFALHLCRKPQCMAIPWQVADSVAFGSLSRKPRKPIQLQRPCVEELFQLHHETLAVKKLAGVLLQLKRRGSGSSSSFGGLGAQHISRLRA